MTADPCLLCRGICPECGGQVGEAAGSLDWILCSACHATFSHTCGKSGVRFTDRLRLEPTAPRHADDLLRIHSDPLVAHWYGGAWTEVEAQRTAQKWAAAWQTDGVHKWVAYDKGTGELVGRGGLSYADVDGVRSLEIGWAILGQLWGHGYASEIGHEGLRFAFDELRAPEVLAFTESLNERSCRVMQRIGMNFLREFSGHGLLPSGEVGDGAIYAIYSARRADFRPTQ